jgi:hypothetical protein
MCALLLALVPLAPPSGTKDLYARVVSRAVERTQKELLSGIDFEVDHSRWEDPWVVRTAHFELRTTHSYAQAAELGRSLEFLRERWVELLGEGQASAAPQRIWVFPTIGDYNRFGNEVGAEHSSLLGCFYADQHPEQPVATYQNGNPTLLGMWVTHGALHQFLAQSFGPQRLTWVDEGLAAYFALFWDWSYGAEQLERIERGSSYVPLARLLADPIQAYANRPDDRFIQLGMLFYFLLDACEATKNGATGDPTTGPFQEFLRAAVRGQDVDDSEFLQTIEEATELLEQDFKDFDFAKR